MYGTIARMRIKPGAEQALNELMREYETMNIPGSVSNLVYRMDNDPNTYFLVVVFESKEAYQANAASPEQNERYQQMMNFMAAPPEWHDGEIIYASNA